MNAGELDFERIYDTFGPKIQRYLTRLVGEHEAEDLTQEVFLKVSQALQTFRGESELSTWIYRIATNAAIDKMRTSSFQQGARASSLDDSEEAEEKALGAGEETSSLELRLMRKERYECFVDFVGNLPANYRTVVALSELEELTNNEIAQVLGLSLDVVKIRLHRGRAMLLKELKSHCKPEDWL